MTDLVTTHDGLPPSWASALHVTNGDSTVPGLRGTGLARRILPWRDVLHEGPVPDVPDAELRQVRTAFLTGAHARDVGAELEERDSTVHAHRDGDFVLWFEADLYDQLQLVQILSRLQALEVPPERITLICVGEYPGIAHFGGLGELTSEQLLDVASGAATLTGGALRYAADAWSAFRAPEPTGLAAVAATASAELRFVAEAFDRLGREYPSTRDGLSLTERRILAAVASGATTAQAVFGRVAARETRPFLGDTWCFDRIALLVAAPHPLLEPELGAPEGGVRRPEALTGLRLTSVGRRVLEGRADHVELNGVDRWLGGVHLRGHQVPYRWHEGIESVTAAAPGSGER